MFQTNVVEEIQAFILGPITFFFFRNSCSVWDNVEICFRVGYATDENVAHSHCMMDTLGYKYTLRLCNTYCFSIVTMVAKTCLSVTFIRTLPVLLNIHLNFVSFWHVLLMRLSFQVFQTKSCMNSLSSTYVGLIHFPTWDFLVKSP